MIEHNRQIGAAKASACSGETPRFGDGLSSLPAPGVRGVWLSMVIGTAVHAMTVLLLRQSPGAGLSRRR